MSLLGNGAQIIALIVSLVSAVALIGGAKGKREGLVNAGFILVLVNTLLLTFCVGLVLVSFLTENYSLAYVVSNFPQDSSPLAWLYRVSGVWAGRQGSLLSWTWLISVFASVVAARRMRVTDELSSCALGVMEVVIALFAATMAFSEANNVFMATAPQYLNPDGTLATGISGGMNPLLLHWAMVLHPPATFIGYAGCTVPFAYAMAALITGDLSARWVELCDRLAVFAFIFLTIGMALGAVWAYVVLGWGGFWAWDAVENASLMSWLTSVAMIHSFTVYRKRGCFKRWSLFSATVTFIFVVLGTFITRSGLVQSVHAFAEDPVSTYLFLGIMVLAGLVFLIGLIYRSGTFEDEDDIESLASKNGTYFLTNLIMIMAACVVAYLTLSSSLPSFLPLGGSVVSAGAYNAVARPVAVVFGALMAVCPLLSWRKTDPAAFAKNIRVPGIAGLVLFAALMALFALRLAPAYDATMAAGGTAAQSLAEQGPKAYYFALTVLAFAVTALLFTTSGYVLLRGIGARRRNKGEGALTALVHLFRYSPAQAGGYLAHLGVAVALAGMVGSMMYVQDQTFNVSADGGETVSIGSYQLTVEAPTQYFDAQDDSVMQVVLNVASSDGAQSLGQLTTSMEVSAATQQQTLHAGVMTFPLEDLFVAFQGLDADGSLVINVKINPLVLCNWIGAGICVAGIALAFLPRRATPLLAADDRARMASEAGEGGQATPQGASRKKGGR